MTIISIQNNSHKTFTGQISLMSLKLVYIYSHETQILDSMVDFIFPFLSPIFWLIINIFCLENLNNSFFSKKKKILNKNFIITTLASCY